MTATEKKLVSICIPAYNCEKYIHDTLCCLTSQTYPEFEIIVVNDGSTDDTLIRIQNIKDPRIKIINAKNGGAAKARNIAFNNSNGSLILFFDADDLVDKNYLFNQIKTLEGKSDSVALAQWGRFNNNNLNSFKLIPNPTHSMNLESWVQEFWYHVNPMTNPGRILIPRDVVDKAGLWNEDLSLNDDLEFFTRIFDSSASILFNDESTFFYRSGINGLSCIKGEKASNSLYKSVKLSTGIVLKKHNNNFTKKACANLWQSLIYEIYPYEKYLSGLAEQELSSLNKADLRYPSGGLSKILISFIGWKLTIKLKLKYLNAKKIR